MENTINITTTGTEIVPYTKKQNTYFENLTSVRDFVRHTNTPTTGFIIEDKHKKSFVTHLHNESFLEAQFPSYTITHKRAVKSKDLTYPININSDITPREVQYEMIQGVINNKEKHQWFIYLSQGLGKTLLSIYLISYFNVKSMIMCYNVHILKQWFCSIRDHTDMDMDRCLLISSSKILEKVLVDDFPYWEYDIFMCTPKLLTSFASRNGYDKLNIIMTKLGIGFKIFDEAHRNIANIIKINAYTSINKTLYLSGDFGQSNKAKENLYFRMFFDVPILKPSDDLMNSLKFTTAIVIKYDSEPSEIEQMSVYTRRGISFYEYMKYQFTKPIFFNALQFVIKEIEKTNVNHYKILILVNLIDHVDVLYDQLTDLYGSYYRIGRFHSKVSDIEKEDCKENCNMIISTYQSFSTGLDVSLIKYVISCSICTKIDDNQSSGRARPLPDGSDAFYFMLADYGFKYTKKKLKERTDYLKETKIKKIVSIDYMG